MAPKIVIVAVPFTDTTSPVMAPALLKSAVIAAGFDCVAFDLNGIVYNKISKHPRFDDFLSFFYFDEICKDFSEEINELFHLMAEEILKHNPDYVALSLLHYQCQVSTKWLCFLLKKYQPDVKIIIGGSGAFGSGLVEYGQTYVESLKSMGLIDHAIAGDADFSLPELLKGNLTYPGIDSASWQEVTDLDSLPYSNFDDYDFSVYESPFVGMLGSRGCVRQCTFCDVHEYWDKFKWRTGQNIFDEMLYHNKKYGNRYFKFQDSLINGNVKEYNALIKLLSDHNKQNPDNSFYWASYFIFRPKTQMSEEQWRLTAESGAIMLNVGIESLVDKNRFHIKKKFNNEDVEYALSMAKKYNLKIFFITLVGYVTETDEDHQESLQWLRNNAHYAGNPIERISVGGTLGILPGTWLSRNQQELGVTWNNGENNPVNGKNHLWEIKATGNDYKTRLERMAEMIKVGQEVGFKIHRAVIDPQKELENLIKDQMNEHVITTHL